MADMQIKICCISNIDEAKLALKLGANALGFVGPMPSGPGIIDDQTIASIIAQMPPFVSTVLLSSSKIPNYIIDQCRKVGANTIQLVDSMETSDYALLRKGLPTVKIMQVVHVLDESSLHLSQKLAPYVDAILLDSGNPIASTKKLGGTGRTHNWKISKSIVQCLDIPVILAGGLNPLNVVKALTSVNPYALDVCSGVRTDGALDENKLKAFIGKIRSLTT